jgi:hypothetical protein
MKRMLIVPFALLFLAGSAAASPLCADEVGLNFYHDNYQGFANACQIGDKLFFNFGYASFTDGVQDNASASADVIMAPAPGDGITNPGLTFGSLPFSVDAGHYMDGTFTYEVVTLSGSALIEDYTLTIAGSHTNPLSTGQAFGTVTESFSNIGSELVTGFGPLSAHTNSAHLDFSPFASDVVVTTKIHVESPAGGGDFVSISLVKEQFSEIIPEPYAAVLIGSGLVLLGLRRIRVKPGA